MQRRARAALTAEGRTLTRLAVSRLAVRLLHEPETGGSALPLRSGP